MVARLRKDAVASEVGALNALIGSLPEDDLIGRQSLGYRRDELAEALRNIEGEMNTLGRVVLSFEGGPVVGSHGIDATFASKTIGAYQDLIAKQVASDEVEMARTGPVPSRASARLNITNVVHGSFGFELEERGADQLGLIDTSVKTAIEEVDNVLVAFAGPSIETFQLALAKVDRRVFISIQAFFENLYRDSASLKIIEDDRDFLIDQYAVISARDRITGATVTDTEIFVRGELLGLTPVSRRFDLSIIEADEIAPGTVLTGQAGRKLSDDYLERIHGDQRISGRVYTAQLTRRQVLRADGTETESYTLVDLIEPGGRISAM